MNQRLYFLISGLVFALAGLFHLIRIIYQWSVQVESLGIPLWPSWLIFVAASALSIWAFRLARRLSVSASAT